MRHPDIKIYAAFMTRSSSRCALALVAAARVAHASPGRRASKYLKTPANTAKMQLGQEPAKYTRISPKYTRKQKDALRRIYSSALYTQIQYTSGD